MPDVLVGSRFSDSNGTMRAVLPTGLNGVGPDIAAPDLLVARFAVCPREKVRPGVSADTAVTDGLKEYLEALGRDTASCASFTCTHDHGA
jgi:hypothetical protein